MTLPVRVDPASCHARDGRWRTSLDRSAVFCQIPLFVAFLVANLNGNPPAAWAQPPDAARTEGSIATAPPADQPSDAHALALLIGEPLLQQNAAEVCLESRSLPAQQRFERLARWVLPGDGHSFRVNGALRRTASAVGQTEVPTDRLAQALVDCPESSWILSPAIDLVASAAELGQLDELARRVNRFASSARQPHRAQQALLCLIEITRGDVLAATQRMEERFSWQREQLAQDLARDLWPDLLILWTAASRPETAHLVTEDLFGVYPSLGLYCEDLESDLIQDYLSFLQGRCRDARRRAEHAASLTAPGSLITAATAEQFDVFARVDANTHGSARPLTRFHIGSGTAHKISGHESDYLAFRTPIVGEFEVSGEIATHAGAFTELMVHGLAVQPVDSGKQVRFSNDAKGNRVVGIQPPLEQLESHSHVRAAFGSNGVTHFFNGRPLYQSPPVETGSPWIGLRSWRRTESLVQNLQLAGSPSVPDSIDLVTHDSLFGWASYSDPDSEQGQGSWTSIVGPDQVRQLVSGDPVGVRGCFDEDLIRYVRPLSWDAIVQYEFFHDPGKAAVHPAFGRSVYLLTPEAVRLHRLTDGRYERSHLRPDNASQLQDLPDAPPGLPLRTGWNHVELRIKQDKLSLWLNSRQVARDTLTPEHARNFGLFRYRDQTRAVVRNVRLTGDWPPAVPPVPMQPLASPVVANLNQTAEHLPAEVDHPFRDGIPPMLFDFDGDETSITAVPDGVRMGRKEGSGVKQMIVCAMIEGDFDIVAEYKDLKISDGEPTWHCGVGLAVNLENATRNRVAINRRRDRMHGHHYIAFGQKEANAVGQLKWTGGVNLVDESTSGKLRLARRGTTVYGLHAIGNSQSYRIVQTTQVPPGPIAINGLRFITDIGRGLETSVTWTNLRIRAEGIDQLRPENESQTLALLNQIRSHNPVQVVDLMRQSLEQAQVYTAFGDNTTLTEDSSGATVTVTSQDSSVRSSLIKNVNLGPEFDVQCDFHIDRIDRGIEMGSSSEVVIQVRLGNPQTLDPFAGQPDDLRIYEATMILRHKGNGKLDLIPRVVGRGRGGKTVYLPIRSVPVNMPDQYRIAQHEGTLYYMYSEKGNDEVKILASYPLDQPMNLSGVAVWTIAGRGERVVKTCWKGFRIHGSEPN